MLMTLSSNIPQSSVPSTVWGNYFCPCLPRFPVQLQVRCLTYSDCWKNKPLISWYVWQKMLVLTLSLHICLFPLNTPKYWMHQVLNQIFFFLMVLLFIHRLSFVHQENGNEGSSNSRGSLEAFYLIVEEGGAHHMKNSLQVASDYLHGGSFKCQEFFPHSCFWYSFSILAAGVGVIFSVGILHSLWNTQCI